MVELDASGKNLNDEGAIFEVATALVESLSYDDAEQGRVVRLEELRLRDCGLNVVSLLAFKPVIVLAANDLRDLDLSGNAITIDTEEALGIWEDFLTSFKDCYVLRRLDLSGNALGPRGFEALLRVYAQEDVVDLVLPLELEEDLQEESQSPSRGVTGLGRRLRKTSIVSNFDNYAGKEPGSPEGSKRRASKHGI